MKRLAVIESPWVGLGGADRAKNYLRACIRDSLFREEIPWASHAMLAWTEALYETDEDQRAEGLEVNKEMMAKADIVAFYLDHGMSPGMQNAWEWAGYYKKPRERRFILAKNRTGHSP